MSGAEFSGNYTHNIDPKGRVTIPAAYREALGDGYTGRCLLYEITYVLRDFELLQPGAVVLGLKLKPLSFEDLPGALRPI